jgi:hypothetical protein
MDLLAHFAQRATSRSNRSYRRHIYSESVTSLPNLRRLSAKRINR